MLFSLHLPKTAGTAFRLYLEANLGRRAAFAYGAGAKDSAGLQPARTCLDDGDPVGAAAALQQADIAFIHGHDTARYLPAAPRAPAITWLRDPLTRLVSEFLQLQRKPDVPHFLAGAVAAGRLSLADFAEQTAPFYDTHWQKLSAGERPVTAFLAESPKAAAAVFAQVLDWRGALPTRNMTPAPDAARAQALIASHGGLREGPLAADYALYDPWRRAWERPTADARSGAALSAAVLAAAVLEEDGPSPTGGGRGLSLRRRLGLWREHLQRRA